MTRFAPLTAHPAAVAAAVGFCLALPVADASAQDLAGTWTLAAETPRGPQEMTLVLAQDGETLSGTLTMTPPDGAPPGGGQGRGPMEVEISEGSVTGASFTFMTTMMRRGSSFTQTFSGTVDGDEMAGTIAGGRGERPFTGTR